MKKEARELIAEIEWLELSCMARARGTGDTLFEQLAKTMKKLADWVRQEER